MKLALTTLLAAGLATSAFAASTAGSSDPGSNTSPLSVTQNSTNIAKGEVKQPRISTRNASKKAPPYAYSNPLGVGPNNDSR